MKQFYQLERIRQLNDEARMRLTDGAVFFTPGICALSTEEQSAILTRVCEFDDFDAENDPYGELTVAGHPDIFVIGDTAQLEGPHGALPGVAPVAKQQGAYVARVISARLKGKSPPGPFRYRSFGNLATIGRKEAVADFGWLKLRGRLAWCVWGVAHIYFLVGFRNRITVAVDWLWSYLTYQRGARLITGEEMRLSPGASKQ